MKPRDHLGPVIRLTITSGLLYEWFSGVSGAPGSMARTWMYILAASPLLAGAALLILVLAYPTLFSGRDWALIATTTLTLLAGLSQVSGVTLRELFTKPREHPVLHAVVKEGSPGYMGASRIWAEIQNIGAADAKNVRIEASLSAGAPFQLSTIAETVPALPVGGGFDLDLVNSLPGGQHGNAVVTIRMRYSDYHGRDYDELTTHALQEVSEAHMREMLRNH